VAAVRGVKRVQVSRALHLDDPASSRFTGADRTRPDYGLSGRGQQIAIIDSGVDYTHAAFGGPRTTAAFADNDDTVIEPGTFPTAKVTSGYDFVGDDFDPDSTEPTHRVVRPDPDPLDCNGHGSHVAGSPPTSLRRPPWPPTGRSVAVAPRRTAR
jgi:subtilisin family serine protease